MDDDPPDPSSLGCPLRIRRSSSSIISSTTSPTFSASQNPTPNVNPGNRLASTLQSSLSSNSNVCNQSHSDSNNGRDSDNDMTCQPSSSTTNFTPPSPRPRPRHSAASASSSSITRSSGPANPLGFPDSPLSVNFRQRPTTPVGMCVVSSSTTDDIPPSPMSFAEEIVDNNNVMLSNESLNQSLSTSSLTSTVTSNANLIASLPVSLVQPTRTSSSVAGPSSIFSSSNTLRNKIKKASSFERFSLQAANNNLTSNNLQDLNSVSGCEASPVQQEVSAASSNIIANSAVHPTSRFNGTMGLSGSNHLEVASLSARPSEDLRNTLISSPSNSNLNQNSSSNLGLNSNISMSSQPSSPFNSNLVSNLNSNLNNNVGASTLNSRPSSSSSTQFWDSIIQSSGASALRQLFINSSEENKSLHLKIPSKKLAAKIASVFEQEEQAQQQLVLQQQNELMSSILGSSNSDQVCNSDKNELVQLAHGHFSLPGSSRGVLLNPRSTQSVLNNLSDGTVAMEIISNDSHENLIGELRESPLNLTDSSNNLKSRDLQGVTAANTRKKMPLTPKQKLLHRMQSGELLGVSPPPSQTTSQANSFHSAELGTQGNINALMSQGTGSNLSIIFGSHPSASLPQAAALNQGSSIPSQGNSMPHGVLCQTSASQLQSNLNFQNLGLLQESSQHSSHTLDPYYENENLLRSRDDFSLAEVTMSSKAGDSEGGVSILYDPDSYSYYYGNVLNDEIFSTTTTTSSAPSSTGRPFLMLPQGSSATSLQEAVDSLQHQQQPHVEFILGIAEQQDSVVLDKGDAGQAHDMLHLDPVQFADADNLSKSQAQADSTLRNLLMMDPVSQDDSANWMSADYSNPSSRNFRSVAVSNSGGGQSVNSVNSLNSPLMLSSDWSRHAWGPVFLPGSNIQEEQDEVMDMSVMDSPEKQRQRHLDPHVMDDVDLLGSMQMPLDLQHPLGLISGVSSSISTVSQESAAISSQESSLTTGKNQIHEHSLKENHPINLQLSHRYPISTDNSEPVNLISVNLENNLPSHRSQHSNLQDDSDQISNTVLQHSSLTSRHSGHTMNHIDSNKHSQIQCGGYITFHAAPQSSDYSLAQDVDVYPNEDESIDERRIIRVKKKDMGQCLSETVAKPTLVSSEPSIILDKPIQPKSFASLPNPLNLLRVSGSEDWAVFTAPFKTLAVNTRFGPVEGPLRRANKNDLNNANATYPCLLMLDSSDNLWQLDRSDDELCNWMKFVRFARNASEQNAVVTEDRGLLYFSTTKEIQPKTELQVGYLPEYAKKYGFTCYSDQDESVVLPTSSPERAEITQHNSFTPNLAIENELSDQDGARPESMENLPNQLSSDMFPCATCKEEFTSAEALSLHVEVTHVNTDSATTKALLKFKHLKKSKFLDEALPAENQDKGVCYKSVSATVEADPVSKKGRHECPTCKVVLTTLVDFKIHVDEHFQQGLTTLRTEEESAKDEMPTKAMLASTQIQKDKTDNRKDVPATSVAAVVAKVKCTMCYKSFATKERLDKHMIVHSDEDTKPLQCEFCPKRFLTNSALAGHIKTHAEEGKCFECPICSFVTQQLLQLKEHVQKHKNKESGLFHCPKCSKKFGMYSMVRKHIRAFHGPRQFGCDQCEMCFPTSDKLKLHKLKHSDHREFLCAECGRQFKRKDKLREHTKRMHEAKKKTLDLQALAHLSSKHRHFKKFVPKTSPEEFKKYIYKCSDCMMGFKRRGMLVNHLAKRHPEKTLEQVPELNMPILRPTRNYFCPYCERVYKSSSKRKSHILKTHPGKELPPQLKVKNSMCVNDAEKLIRVCVRPSDVQLPETRKKPTDGVESKQYREVSVVGKVMATPHSCQWCHRQYATRAKLLQHQRKSHLHLMPLDMQLPRTQKNNVLKTSEENSSTSPAVCDYNVITTNTPCATGMNSVSSALTTNAKSSSTEVIVAHLLKGGAGMSEQLSSTSASSSILGSNSSAQIDKTAPDGTSSSPQASTASNTLVVTSGNANVAGMTTTAIALNAAQMQQLQLQGLGVTAEESGSVIGFLLTTASVNSEFGTLVPSEIMVLPIQQQQTYPAISAAANVIQQPVLKNTPRATGNLEGKRNN